MSKNTNNIQRQLDTVLKRLSDIEREIRDLREQTAYLYKPGPVGVPPADPKPKPAPMDQYWVDDQSAIPFDPSRHVMWSYSNWNQPFPNTYNPTTKATTGDD